MEQLKTAAETSYLTTSIPYVNGRPHVGHALENVQADLFARYRRQIGWRVRLQTGSDDNSLKNVQAAESEGITVAALVERNAAEFRRLADELGVGYDGFIRTSADPRHAAGVTALWRACAAAGAIYRRAYRGLYCVGCEQFYTEAELTPDGLCPEHGTRPELVEEENYFFRLSRYAAQLHALIASGELRIVPEGRRNEVLAFIAGGLEDFSISRSHQRARGWGVPVPDDPMQVMYVWFDALGNYITALGYGSPDTGAPLYETFWSGSDERIHVIGKGILRFHAVYWPAMLLAAGLPLPTTVFVHGYLTVEGRKIGKSLGNAIDPSDLVTRYGADAVRWYLLREVHPTADGDFAVERLIDCYNRDIANGLGNLLNRAAAMVHRYRGGVIPAPDACVRATDALATLAAGLPERIGAAMDAYDPRAALAAMWELVSRANEAVEETAPWALARAERDGDAAAGRQLDAVLYALLEAVRLAAVHLEPFLPVPAARILARLGEPDAAGQSYAERMRWGGLASGRRLAAPAPLFPRLEIDGTS
jgi:methionyl-tRNA synthetase